MVGACSLPEGWCGLPNVYLLGRRDYTEVAAYMAACDVLIMPWNSGEWIRACNPVKLKEYLAVGRPVVSTPFDELAAYGGLVRVARDAGSFAVAIRASLHEVQEGRHDPEPGRARVREQTWAAKAGAVVDLLERRGVQLRAPDERVGSSATLSRDGAAPAAQRLRRPPALREQVSDPASSGPSAAHDPALASARDSG
jgi:hypothetical protein